MARRPKQTALATRSDILDAAERLFNSTGVAQTSLEQIAEEAGVTRGAIYWHFADKVALFRALHERVRLPQEEIVEQAAAGGNPDPLNLLETIAYDCLKTLIADPQRQRVYSILLFRCDYFGELSEALQRQREADKAMFLNLTRLFDMARHNGSLSPDWEPDIAARGFSSMMRGLWMEWLRYDQSFDLMETGTKCIGALFRSLRATPSAS